MVSTHAVRVVAVLALVLVAGGSGAAAQPAPQSAAHRETVHASGLTYPVEIVTDRWGISHIYAENEHDLFFAQGYAAARDRLFQFEIWRRARDRHGGRHPGPARAGAGHQRAAVPLPGRHGDRDAPLPRAGRRDHPRVRRRRQRLRRPDRRGARPAPAGVRAAGHRARPLDAGSGRLPAPGAGVERGAGDRQRARRGRARSGRRRGAQLLHRRARPDARSGHRRGASHAGHPRPLPRPPAGARLRAGRRRRRLPRGPRGVRAAGGRDAVRDRPGGRRAGRDRQQQLGGARQPDAERLSDHGERPAPRAVGAVAALLGAPGGAGLERHRRRRAGAAGRVDRPQRARRVGPDRVRPGQRGPLRLRDRPGRPATATATSAAGRR